jgi:hypothetical protein
MDQARRERIRELMRTLESAQRQVHDLWIAEESAFEGRSPPSKETELWPAPGLNDTRLS